MARLFVLWLLVLSVACSSEEKPSDSSADTQATDTEKGQGAPKADGVHTGKLFTEDLRKEPCKLLSAAMVAGVAGVAEAEVEQRAIASMCLYEWKGGNASLGFVRVDKTAKERGERFDREHKAMTGEEVKAAMDKVSKKLEEREKEGKSKVSAKSAKTVGGGVAKALQGGIHYEPVDGVGDRAAFDASRHEQKILDKTIVNYANKMGVLVGNMSFMVTFTKKTGREGLMYRDEVIALGKAVVAGLGK